MRFTQVRIRLLVVALLHVGFSVIAQKTAAQIPEHNPGATHGNKFEPLDAIFPSPNVFRSASGAPGPQYWQQQADYNISVRLDDKKQRITGKAKVTYHNNSPDQLKYLWLQLDENENLPNSERRLTETNTVSSDFNAEAIRAIRKPQQRMPGIQISAIRGRGNQNLEYWIEGTMMRISLPEPIEPKSIYGFEIDWWFDMVDRSTDRDPRGGYEYFPEDENYLFVVTQWFPRFAVYNDYGGWNNRQFLYSGEFALEFGNYEVEIDVPDDYIVAATGECSNYGNVLSREQLQRLEFARNSDEPVEIISLQEALDNAKKPRSNKRKVWHFTANKVRDFAWTASRRYAWDAMRVLIDDAEQPILAMSLYGKEAYPLFRKYSTKLVRLTLETYSEHSFPYPYPVAISVEAANDMEYPMIAFNTGRVDKNGNYTQAEFDYMTWILIHEVGHNFFPMVVNSNERKWTFMDEGFNTFLQYFTEMRWNHSFPSLAGPPYKIAKYMKGEKTGLEPIMTVSDNVKQFYRSQYAKTATALVILRNTILGPELFDFAFKTYAARWKFKHPRPYDFFRTMSDATAVNLDWFWRGWFFSTDMVDIAIEEATEYKIDHRSDTLKKTSSGELDTTNYLSRFTPYDRLADTVTPLIERDTSLQNDQYKAAKAAGRLPASRELPYPSKNELYPSRDAKYAYEIRFKNKGGLVMPLIIKWEFKDGTSEIERIPVTVWRRNEEEVKKVFFKGHEVKSIVLDPFVETADVDLSNQVWIF